VAWGSIVALDRVIDIIVLRVALFICRVLCVGLVNQILRDSIGNLVVSAHSGVGIPVMLVSVPLVTVRAPRVISLWMVKRVSIGRVVSIRVIVVAIVVWSIVIWSIVVANSI